MKIRRIVSVGTAVALVLILTVAVQAQTIPTLDRARSSTLVGDSAGAFDQYILKHPGGGQSINLQMTYRPVHPNAELGIGFKVYGENGKLVGVSRKVSGTGGVLELALTTNRATQYLVQVQNYYPGFRMSYTLDPQGLAAAAGPAPQPTAEAGTAQNPGRLVNLAQGQVAGNRAGSFDYYRLEGQPDESIWIKMTYQPTNAVIAPGVGFNVYRGSQRLAQGQTLEENRTGLWANLIPGESGTYLVQVYNYIPGVLVDYELEVTTQPAEGETD